MSEPFPREMLPHNKWLNEATMSRCSDVYLYSRHHPWVGELRSNKWNRQAHACRDNNARWQVPCHWKIPIYLCLIRCEYFRVLYWKMLKVSACWCLNEPWNELFFSWLQIPFSLLHRGGKRLLSIKVITKVKVLWHVQHHSNLKYYSTYN